MSALLEEFDRETAPAASPDGSPELHAAANGNDPTAVNEALARSQNAWLEAQKSGMATDLMKSRIMDKMLKAAKAMPDPQATEDRWAVAAAVRYVEQGA